MRPAGQACTICMYSECGPRAKKKKRFAAPWLKDAVTATVADVIDTGGSRSPTKLKWLTIIHDISWPVAMFSQPFLPFLFDLNSSDRLWHCSVLPFFFLNLNSCCCCCYNHLRGRKCESAYLGGFGITMAIYECVCVCGAGRWLIDVHLLAERMTRQISVELAIVRSFLVREIWKRC